jgi:hypothetical protein
MEHVQADGFLINHQSSKFACYHYGQKLILCLSTIPWKSYYFFLVVKEPNSGLSRPIFEVTRSHTIRNTHSLLGFLWMWWSACCRGRYLHNKHKRGTSMPSAGFNPGIPEIKLLQTYVLGRTATLSAFGKVWTDENKCVSHKYKNIKTRAISTKPCLTLLHKGYMQRYQAPLVRTKTESLATFKFREFLGSTSYVLELWMQVERWGRCGNPV